MNWISYKDEFFKGQGKWRIVINSVTCSEWQKIHRFLKKTAVNLNFYINDVQSTLVDNISDIFRNTESYYRLSLAFDGLVLDCNIDREDTMVFEFDPGQIIDEARAILLFRIMSTFGRRLNRMVLLYDSSEESQPLFRYEPGQGLSYVKLGIKLAPYE